MPIIAVSWGLFDGEKFSGYQALATLIILIGVYLSNKKKTIRS
jgi:drug/metabolite transporter (DMT)-like permease